LIANISFIIVIVWPSFINLSDGINSNSMI